MNVEILKNAGIDYDFGVKRFVGRAQLFEKYLLKFSEDNTFSRIRTAFGANDRQELMASVHEFKGMCGNIGLTSLYEAADTIVQMLRGGSFTDDELSRAYDLICNKYDTIHAAIAASTGATI